MASTLIYRSESGTAPAVRCDRDHEDGSMCEAILTADGTCPEAARHEPYRCEADLKSGYVCERRLRWDDTCPNAEDHSTAWGTSTSWLPLDEV
jgi:hypothetical protein